MSGLRPSHLVADVIRPTLMYLGERYATPAAQQLLLGTAVVESQLMWLHQLGAGPARGLWQMEPATYDDHIKWLRARDNIELEHKIIALRLSGIPHTTQLAGNLYYACAMARVHYWRVSAPLPAANDIEGLGRYWKAYYNTRLGKGTVANFVNAWNLSVREMVA